MTVVVRPARPEDLEQVGRLTARAYVLEGYLPEDHEYVTELRDAWSRAGQATVLVAVEPEARASTAELADAAGAPDAAGAVGEDEVVLGSITLARHGSPFAEVAQEGEAEIRMLAVVPEARGRGLGEMLVRAAMREAAASGAHTLVLTSLEEMHAAHRIYGSLGLRRSPERDWDVDGRPMLVYVGALGGPPVVQP